MMASEAALQEARRALTRATAALTQNMIQHVSTDGRVLAEGAEIALLERSIGNDLLHIERQMGRKCVGTTILSALAASIDEALLALEEAQAALSPPHAGGPRA